MTARESTVAGERIPLTVIGGYLGAGKTTLLNHILRHNDDRRLAVIVNDFGSINIDAELIVSQDAETINLANGCICCTLAGGFAMALHQLARLENPPEHIVIEASGVADPAKVSQYGHMRGLRLDGVIVVVDADLVRQKSRDKYVGRAVVEQLQGADLLILNKVDLVTDEERTAVRAWLHEQVTGAHIIEAEQAKVPLPLLLDVAGKGPDVLEVEDLISHGDPHKHHHDLEYDTWSYVADEPLDGDAFRAFVERLSEDVIRAKGVLYLREDPDQRTIFQLVGKRWSLRPGGDWGDLQPGSRLVMIGLPGSLDAGSLEEMLQAASL
jgi:G3E family GTPase